MAKYILWTIVGSLLTFGGWILKDQPYSKQAGQFIMSLGFTVYAVILISLMWKDFNPKK